MKCGANAVVMGLCGVTDVFEDCILNMQNDFFSHTAAYFCHCSAFFAIEDGVHSFRIRCSLVLQNM